MNELYPIKASAYLKFPEQARTDLTLSGVIAVNDKLFPIWDDNYDIRLLFGGRGGGKSEAEADKLLHESLTEKYFKCYYGRKVYDTVRGSSFATLVFCIKKNKMDHLFKYSESDSSGMVITCKKNGNKFIPFGSDKADKLKSIKDPTHIWCEEFDQFDFDDFKELYPTLRTIRGANRFSGTFNTHAVYPFHWILKVFFPDLYEGTDKDDTQNIDLLKGKRVQKIFVNFTDNYFIDQEDYRNNLWLSSSGNQTIFEGIANGAWGINLNDSPYAFAFDRNKHVSNPDRGVQHPVLDRSKPLLLSFDFNRNPMSCLVGQLVENKLNILEAIKLPRSGVEGICNHILTWYPGCLYIITGDYNGNNESSLFAEQVTHYKLIKQYLNLSDGQIKVLPNPKQAKNSTHVNNVLAWFPINIHAEKARGLIFDLENVKRRADGTILKEDRDKPEQQSDLLDCFIGETMILTTKGGKRIDAIEIGENVLTRSGYKKVIDKWDSLAEVWEFELNNGIKITCTKDHKFYVNGIGYIPILSIFNNKLNVCQLRAEEYLNQRQKMKELSIMEDATINIQGRNISIPAIRKIIANAFIGKCGLMLSGKYQKDLISIIETEMPSIIPYQILNLKKKISIKANILKKESKKILNSLLTFKRRELLLPRNGINQRRAKSGIDKMQLHADLVIRPTEKRDASFVQKNLQLEEVKQDSVLIIAKAHGGERINQIKKQQYAQHVVMNLQPLNICQPNTVQKNVSQRQIHTEVSVKKASYKGIQKVYDITVHDNHEFYANGILVHNCFRYMSNAFLDWFNPIQYAKENQAKAAPGQIIKAVDTLSKFEYLEKRASLLNQAGKYLATADTSRAQIALMEVKRLDELFKK